MEKKNESFGKEIFALAKKHNIDLSTVNNIQDWFNDLLEGTMKAEFDNHMSYEKHERNQSFQLSQRKSKQNGKK